MKNKLLQKGQAAILTIFILGMIAVYIGISQLQLGSLESFRGRGSADSLQAYYSANSGIEHAIYELNTDENYTGEDLTIPSSLPSPNVKITVTGGETAKIITSVAKNGSFVRRIRVGVSKSSVTPGFSYAVHAGAGGFELANNATVTGNVYSKSDISGGSSNSNCGGNPALIDGIATASGSLKNLNGSGNGVCVTSDSYANSYYNCYVQGTANYIDTANTPSNCSNNPPSQQISSIETVEFPFSDEGIQGLADQIDTPPYVGNCYIGGPNDTPLCYDIVSGIPTIGNLVILGNLEISVSNVNFSGSVWVKNTGAGDTRNDVEINSNTTIGLTSDLDNAGPLLIVDGKIKIRSNLTFIPNASTTPGRKVYLLPISRYPLDSVSNVCVQDNISTTQNSIYIQANVNDVIFYAPHGCLYIKGSGNGQYNGSAIGEKVYLGNQGTLTYDPELFGAVFGSNSGTGWQILSFKEY